MARTPILCRPNTQLRSGRKSVRICVEQAVILEADATRARAAARQHMSFYVTHLPNYRNNLKALGWQDVDFDNGCSDRLVDAVVAWGTEDRIHDRIQAHFTAGATHVCIRPHPGRRGTVRREFRRTDGSGDFCDECPAVPGDGDQRTRADLDRNWLDARLGEVYLTIPFSFLKRTANASGIWQHC